MTNFTQLYLLQNKTCDATVPSNNITMSLNHVNKWCYKYISIHSVLNPCFFILQLHVYQTFQPPKSRNHEILSLLVEKSVTLGQNPWDNALHHRKCEMNTKTIISCRQNYQVLCPDFGLGWIYIRILKKTINNTRGGVNPSKLKLTFLALINIQILPTIQNSHITLIITSWVIYGQKKSNSRWSAKLARMNAFLL